MISPVAGKWSWYSADCKNEEMSKDIFLVCTMGAKHMPFWLLTLWKNQTYLLFTLLAPRLG